MLCELSLQQLINPEGDIERDAQLANLCHILSAKQCIRIATNRADKSISDVYVGINAKET